MQQYQVTLKNEKRRYYHRIAILLIFINFALFIFFSFTASEKLHRIVSIVGAILIATMLAIDFSVYRNRSDEGFPNRFFAFIVIALAWWQLDVWWLGVIFVISDILYQIAQRSLQVTFSNEGITYPAIIQKKINWTDCSTVILKDDLLTIDLKNNHIIQQPVDERKTTINEKDFNDFCREKLNV